MYARVTNLIIFRPVTPAPDKIGCKITSTRKESKKTNNFDFMISLKETFNFLVKIRYNNKGAKLNKGNNKKINFSLRGIS